MKEGNLARHLCVVHRGKCATLCAATDKARSLVQMTKMKLRMGLCLHVPAIKLAFLCISASKCARLYLPAYRIRNKPIVLLC